MGYFEQECPIFYFRGSLTRLRGYSYNLVNGKVERERLRNKAEFQEEINENITLQKFTMPNVKSGTVIEYQYSILSDYYFNLRKWAFQKEIPVMYSQFKARIPEYFTYNPIYRGFHKINYAEKGYQGNKSSYWFSKNLPAIEDEPYVPNYREYITRIKFELKSINLPNSDIQKYTSSWLQVNKKLLEHDDFGDQLQGGNFVEDKVIELTGSTDAPKSKMIAIYNHVKENFDWNDESRMMTSTRLRKIFDEKGGNSADINLLLTLMLQKAGLNADPVILSTRMHGHVYPVFPSITQFNYVIASVSIDGNRYLLDATEPFNIINMLPPRCLNRRGRLINNKGGHWIPLLKDQKREKNIMAQLSFDDSLNCEGTISHEYKDYSVLDLLAAARDSEENSTLKGNLKDTKSALTMDSIKVVNLSGNDEENMGNVTIKTNYSFASNEYFQKAGNRIYFDPLLSFKMEENPYKLEERNLPVDHACPRKRTYILQLTLPEGYQLVDKPEKKVVQFSKKGGKFIYSVTLMGNRIMVVSRYDVEKTFMKIPR